MKRLFLLVGCLSLFSLQAYKSALKLLEGRISISVDRVYQERQAFPSISICPILEPGTLPFNKTMQQLYEESIGTLDLVKFVHQSSELGKPR